MLGAQVEQQGLHWNVYEYCNSNVLRYTDPLGLYSCDKSPAATYTASGTDSFFWNTSAAAFAAEKAQSLKAGFLNNHYSTVCSQLSCAKYLTGDGNCEDPCRAAFGGASGVDVTVTKADHTTNTFTWTPKAIVKCGCGFVGYGPEPPGFEPPEHSEPVYPPVLEPVD